MTINITTEMITIIALFAGLQVINVILNSLKTLIMAKTDNAHASAGINALTFGFYTLIVNQIAHLPLEITVPTTVVTNVIGVYITYAIFKRLQKDSLWKVEIYTGENTELITALTTCGVMKAINTPQFVTMYCYTQADSRTVNEILKSYPVARYNITEIKKKF